MIKLDNIVKEYITGKNKFRAVDRINLEILRGEFLAITGRSGSGKSTVLNLIGLLDTPSSGNIIYDGVNINNLCNKEQALFRNMKIGFVFQSYYLEPTFSVYENIEIPLLIGKKSINERKKLIYKQLDTVGLNDKKNEIVKNLSGGEKQRVAIARALVNNPDIILADEPCGNLDINNSKIIINLLRNFANNSTTVILVTHNLHDAKIADRIITLEDGKIVNEEIMV